MNTAKALSPGKELSFIISGGFIVNLNKDINESYLYALSN